MKFESRIRIACLSVALFVCALLPALVPNVRAQEAGGELGGGAGIFRPKNPETKSKRRTTPGVKAPGGSRPPKPKVSNRPSGPSPAELEEMVEDKLDEGNEARDARDYPAAEKAYREASQLKPKDHRAYYGLGNIYTDQQRWEEAEKAYRQAVQYNQLSADAQVALSYVLVQPRSGGALAKRLVDAEMAARRAIQLQPNNAIAYDRLGVALEGRGLINSETEGAYRKAVETDPQFAVAHVHLGRLLRRMGRTSEGDPYYRRATELANDAPTLVFVAEAFDSEQRYDLAEPLLRRALQMDAKNVSALYFLGKLLVATRRYNEAEPVLQSVIEISPRSVAPYSLLGSAYLRQDRYEESERMYTRAGEFASAGERRNLAGSFGLMGVGDGYLKAGRSNDALRVYQRALEWDSTSAELPNRIARARGN
ncbi:MAG: tetratricopeptide repeat protein [Acidobacteria bacterium]|nr:tetratricopeptide repeat protein [Acidobacteriota bacterium]